MKEEKWEQSAAGGGQITTQLSTKDTQTSQLWLGTERTETAQPDHQLKTF